LFGLLIEESEVEGTAAMPIPDAEKEEDIAK